MLPLARLVSVLYVERRRSIVRGAKDEAEAKRRLSEFDDAMGWAVDEDERRRTWGATPEALAEQNAMMTMLGGPG